MANVLNELYYNLNGWTKNLQFFPTFSNSYANGINSFSYQGGDGYERLYIPIEVESGWNYTFKFKLHSPSGFEMGDYGLNEAFAFVCPDPPTDANAALSRKILGRSIGWDTNASEVAKEYEVSFFTGNYTTVFLVFDLGYIKDGVTAQFIISDIQLDDGATLDDYEKKYIISRKTLYDIAKKTRNILEMYDLLKPGHMISLLNWVNDPFTNYPILTTDNNDFSAEDYCIISWKTLKKIANITRHLMDIDQSLSTAEIIELLDQVKLIKVVNISNLDSEGTQIAIEFSEPIIGIYDNPNDIFTVKTKEYDMVPGGTLKEKTKEVIRVSNQNDNNNILVLYFKEGNTTSIQNSIDDIEIIYGHEVLSSSQQGKKIGPFIQKFSPKGLNAKNNPHVEEHINISNIKAAANLIPIIYNNCYDNENINIIDVNAIGKLIEIKYINSIEKEHITISNIKATANLIPIHYINAQEVEHISINKITAQGVLTRLEDI